MKDINMKNNRITKCSICIPTYKRAETLNSLLSCLVGIEDIRIGEILIGISYDENESINWLTKCLLRALEIKNIPYTLRSDIPGFLAAKRWFKETAKNDILLIIDDDTIITKNYLNLLKHFENDKNVSVVSGTYHIPVDPGCYDDYAYEKIKNPPEGLVCNKVYVDKDGIVKVKDKYQVYMLEQPRVYECECLIGGAMFIRKDDLEIDDNYNQSSCSYEDYDQTYNLYKQNKKVLLDSSEIAFHNRNLTGGMAGKRGTDCNINSEYFKKKYNL